MGYIDKNHKKPWSEYELSLLKQYPKLTKREICDQLDRSLESVRKKIHRLNVAGDNINYQRKYDLNMGFFDVWSSDLSYILGYMMADACITKQGFQFSVNINDLPVMNFIKKCVSPNSKIYYEKTRPVIQLHINSALLPEKLKKYNLIPRKTFNEILPFIPDEYKRDYLRGLFDGDGCFCRSKPDSKAYSKLYICSASLSFLKQVQSKLTFNYGKIYKTQTCYTLGIWRKKELGKILSFMYYKDCFCLYRKRDKVVDAIERGIVHGVDLL